MDDLKTHTPEDWLTAPGLPAIHMFTTEEVQPHVVAQFGGEAWAGPDFQWPVNANGKPLSLLARIDLSSVQQYLPTEWLPKTGQLMFFYDLDEQPWGFDPKDRFGWKVVYQK